MKPSAAVLCGVCMWACGDQRAVVASSLVAAVAEPAGANCAAGGEAIEIGVDRNANGVLDPSEITATTYVCAPPAGAPGSSTLVDVVAEPPGAHCANGGQAIETGVDANGNGMLDAVEVSQVSYVCAGADGTEPLIRIDVEPAGAHCSAGGSAIRVGIDANNDMMLEDSEIQSTSYLCRPANATVIDGSFTVANSVDAAQLAGVTTITGNLTIDAVGLTTIDLGSLQTVLGTLTYDGFSGVTLAMPALTSVGGFTAFGPSTAAPVEMPVLTRSGFVHVSAVAMSALTFPALATIDGDLSIGGSTALTTVSFPALTAAHDIAISGCPAITSLDFSHVATSGYVSFVDNTSLASLSLHLISVGDLSLSNLSLTVLDLSSLTTISQGLDLGLMPELASVDLSSLTSIGGVLLIESLDALSTLALPALTSVSSAISSGATVEIDENPSLTSITAPLWTTYGPTPPTPNVQIGIYDNPHLPTCEAQALMAQFGALNNFSLNDDDAASCP